MRARAPAISRHASWAMRSKIAGPGAVWNGAALTRGLEFSAREKGVKFMLNRRMTEIIREQQFSGRVLGIKASYTPRFDPDTGAQLESLWDNGNIDERRETVYIRAKVAVFVGSGGHGANPQFRSMFYPAMQRAGVRVERLGPDGAARPGCQRHHCRHADRRQSGGDAAEPADEPEPSTSRRGWRPATPTPTCIRVIRPSRSGVPPASRSGTSSYEHLIAVNQVGKRFYNELNLARRHDTPVWPGGPRVGAPKPSMQHVQGDWRNCHPSLGQADVQLFPCRRRRACDERGLAGAELLLRTAVGDLRQRHGRARRVGHQAALHRRTTATSSAPTPSTSWPRRSTRVTNSSGCRSSTSRTRSASGTPTSTRATIPISGAARTPRCTRSTSRRSTPPRSARSGTTPMAGCGSTARRRSSTRRAR